MEQKIEPDARRWVKNAWSDKDPNMVTFQQAAKETGKTIAYVSARVRANDVAGDKTKKRVSLSGLIVYLQTRKPQVK